jgi:hypothetical protein
MGAKDLARDGTVGLSPVARAGAVVRPPPASQRPLFPLRLTRETGMSTPDAEDWDAAAKGAAGAGGSHAGGPKRGLDCRNLSRHARYGRRAIQSGHRASSGSGPIRQQRSRGGIREACSRRSQASRQFEGHEYSTPDSPSDHPPGEFSRATAPISRLVRKSRRPGRNSSRLAKINLGICHLEATGEVTPYKPPADASGSGTPAVDMNLHGDDFLNQLGCPG